MRLWKPIFIEDSWVPVVLSKFAPIEIGAITLGIVVFSRGKMDERVRRHETIHFQQFLETGFLGFLFVYVWDYLRSLTRGVSGEAAYKAIRAEVEAYENEEDMVYLLNRKRYRWLSRS